MSNSPFTLVIPITAFVLAANLTGCGGGGGTGVAALPIPQASAQSQCEAFFGGSYEGALITSATLVPAEGTKPETCVVLGEMQQDLDFKVYMPTTWNRRTVFIGGGAFDGLIRDPSSTVFAGPDLPERGYAIVSTNHGHTAAGGNEADATFALNAGMLADYAYLSVPRVLAPAKAILRQRYGADFISTKLVYEGCSGGGRQALMQAQRYPDFFDGVISRAPANAFTSQFLWYQKVAQQNAKPGATITRAKGTAISNAVMEKCDGLDGLVDHIVSHPEACPFDPAELACTGAETDTCLTPAHVESARAFYAPLSVASGKYTWPGWLVGGEANWPPGFAALGPGYINYMLLQDTSMDWLTVDPAQYTGRIDQLASMLDAIDPDLTRFRARSGKMILWGGMSDTVTNINGATDYYQAVVAKAGSQTAADEFVEYYRSPGVNHCQGGTGADKIDFVGPMFDWIEKGIKPSSTTIVAGQYKPVAGTAPLSRPLCRYPQYPKYVAGDPKAAASFSCTTP